MRKNKIQSTLHGLEGGSPSCFVDSDVVRRHLVWEHQRLHVINLLFEGTPSTCIRQSACREKEREHCSPRLVAGTRHEVETVP